jgi:hypothetical protein
VRLGKSTFVSVSTPRRRAKAIRQYSAGAQMVPRSYILSKNLKVDASIAKVRFLQLHMGFQIVTEAAFSDMTNEILVVRLCMIAIIAFLSVITNSNETHT